MESQIFVEPSNDYQKENCKNIRWLYIFEKKPTQNQRIKINKFLIWKGKFQNNCGLIQDYYSIMKHILKEDQKQKIYLVVDLKSYKDIFLSKKYKNDSFQSKFSKIYVFPKDQKEKEIIKTRIKNFNPLVRDTFDSFQKFIELSPQKILEEEFKSQQNLFKEDYQKIAMNFNLIEEKLSNQTRTKIISFINLQQKQFDNYLQKFETAFKKFSSRSQEVVGKINDAILNFKEGNKELFYKIILSLYKSQHCKFYSFINISLRNLRNKNSNWDQVALPVFLLFKAIKFYYEKESNRQKINKLFDENGQCILWRVTWISQKQLHQIKQKNKQPHVFYQLAGFTSTSLSKAIAASFIKVQDVCQSCLIKFIIKKPTFQKQTDYLNFMYLSFIKFDEQIFQRGVQLNPQAKMGVKQDSLKVEQEVLLNTLTVCKVTKVGIQQFQQIKKLNYNQLQRIKKAWQSDIPLIQINVIQNVLQQFSHSDWTIDSNIQNQINDRNQQDLINYILQNRLHKMTNSIKQYFIIIDLLKNHEKFRIGHAKKYLGQYLQALDYFKQLKNGYISQNLRQVYNCQMQIADIYQKMGKYKQSLQAIQQSIKICNKMKQVSKDMTQRDYHILMYRMIEKSTRTLQQNNLTYTALQKITKRLQKLQQLSQKEANKRQARRFFYAQLLIQRAMIYFRFSKIQQARQDIQKSKIIIDKVMKQIEYEKLKEQTFYIKYYIKFLVHLLIGEKLKIEYQKFQELHQIQNIKQATYIFGGETKLLQVSNNSQHFSKQIDQFIVKHKENLSQQVFTDQVQYNKRLLKDTQKHFQEQKQSTSQGLKKQVQQFFSDFKKKLNENSQTKMLKKLRKSLQTLLLFDIEDISIKNLMIYQKKLRILKKTFVNIKLKSSKQKPQQDYSYSQQQQKLDRLIQYKRQQNKKFIQAHYKDKNGYQQYFQQNIQLMDNNSEGLPVLQHLANKKYQLQLQDYLGMDSKYKKTLQNTINNFKNIPVNSKMIELHFKKIRLKYTQCQIDFENRLQKISLTIRQLQQNQISQCKNSLKEIQNFIKLYQQAQSIVNQISKDDEENKKQFISQKSVLASLWQLKILLFGWQIERDMPSNQKNKQKKMLKLLQNNLVNCRTKINRLQHKPDQFFAQYFQISSCFLYMQKKLRQSFEEMIKSIQKAKDRVMRVYILTKFFFMFQDNKQNKTEFPKSQIQQLKEQYQSQKETSLYWRICLAYHYHFAYEEQNCYALVKCLEILQYRGSQKYHLLEPQQKKYSSYKLGSQFLEKMKKNKKIQQFGKDLLLKAKKDFDAHLIYKLRNTSKK